MGASRKIKVEIPEELLAKAQKASGAEITETVRTGLQLVAASQALLEVSLIEVQPGFWERAGQLRAKVLARRRKARLGDALIAQSCIDRGILLVTRDGDFKAFADSLKLDLTVA